mmetsp:Transcript_65343/g.124531  ORF Transcript_65343/g.124531 Transcript_65343/m.124531 type:complete len:292 (+) Transcript_65343:110-985(+)
MAEVYPYDNVPLKGSVDSDGDESGGEGDDSLPLPVCLCFCCCLCLILAIPLTAAIIVAVSSKGLTECPPQPPIGTDATWLPNHHILVNDAYQGSSSAMSGNGEWYRQIPLYSPASIALADPLPLGHWRETRSWYLKSQWAYIVDNQTTPLIIAWQPYFAWTSTYNVRRCYPLEEHILKMDIFWWRFSFTEEQARWTVFKDTGVVVASSASVKSRWYIDGWDTDVFSPTGVFIGNMTQTVNTLWTHGGSAGTETSVNVVRSDLLKPYVMSFMSAGVDVSRRRRSDRRLREQP